MKVPGTIAVDNLFSHLAQIGYNQFRGDPMTVLLRDVIDSDLPIFYEQQLDPDAIRMAAFPSRDLAAFMAHWAKIRADEANILRTILFNGQVTGNMQSFVQGGEREVGYWIGKQFWGQGIATQALAAFLQQVTQRPLFAHVAKHNLASRRVLEKCGFAIIGEGSWSPTATWSPTANGEQVEEYILKIEDR
jgi:RimJ/RimL family protein N-acetyltransferase